MEDLDEAIKSLGLEDPNDEFIDYEFITIFKNPNKLPITQIHLERQSIQLRKDLHWDSLKLTDVESKCFEYKTEVIPALHKSWLPTSQVFYPYVPFNFTSKESNGSFTVQNYKFLQTLNYLLCCNYHQFWCSVLFEPQIRLSLHSFLLNPILRHQVEELDDQCKAVYFTVLSQFLVVYERLLTFRESPTEYMAEDVGLKHLLETKLINLPIVLTLVLLYQEINLKFVNRLVALYFSDESLFRDREIEEMLKQVVMTLEMVGGHVCGFEKGAVIVPIAIEERPAIFSLSWVYSVVNYLHSTVATLNTLLNFYTPSVVVALDKAIPYRLSFTYERVFHSLYDMLNGRPEVEKQPKLSQSIYDEIALARSTFVDVYNCFVSHCLAKTIEFSGDPMGQQEFIEIYLKLMSTALEDEFFVCDYHDRYDVGAQNETFAHCCTELDETRTDYILNCITSLRRHNRITKTLKNGDKTLKKVMEKYANSKRFKIEKPSVKVNGVTPQAPPAEPPKPIIPSENQIEDSIKIVIDMFPHLGDGFVLKCLEAYNYQATDVIAAILEENLPPHIVDIPFGEIRIPPEPEPPVPILAYRGHKPDYDDALKLLNDKKDMKQIKTFILDGIQYTNEYDVYDDEYDDRQDEETVKVADHGSEDILKYNPNYADDAVSDTSYSENEYDDKGGRVATTNDDRGSRGAPSRDDRYKKGNFCEDPAVIRARREAKLRSQGKIRDVVGKPKGVGQDKNVLQNRQKKSVNKSSKANHSRKSGAQWKRNTGMMPS